MAIGHGRPVVFNVKKIAGLSDNQRCVSIGSAQPLTYLVLGDVVIDVESPRCKNGRTPFTAVIQRITGPDCDKLQVGDEVCGHFQATAFEGNGVLTVSAASVPHCA